MSSLDHTYWCTRALHAAQYYVNSVGFPTLACAESLTAGLVCATLADIPGASRVLRGGVVTYATELKETLAGVPHSVLSADGAVAASTAVQMAAGVRARAGAGLGLGVTGVAGPDRQEGKPVGLVYIGYSFQAAPSSGHSCGVYTAAEIVGQEFGASCVTQCEGYPVVPGDRATIRWAAVCAALTLASRLAGNKIDTSFVYQGDEN